jgi:hypothetical protein
VIRAIEGLWGSEILSGAKIKDDDNDDDDDSDGTFSPMKSFSEVNIME